MKKIILFSVLVFVVAGCIEYQEKMKINNDGSGEITFAIGINESFFQMGGESPEMKEFDENKLKEKFQNQKGIKFTGSKTYSKEGNRWIEVQLAFDSVNDLMNASRDSTGQDIIGNISLKEDKDGNMVFERILSTKNDGEKTDSASTDLGNGMMEAMFGQYKWKYELTVPGNIISSNAQENDIDRSTNTVKWALSLMSLSKSKTLTVVYSTGSSSNITYILLIVIACLVLGFVLLALLKRKKDIDVRS